MDILRLILRRLAFRFGLILTVAGVVFLAMPYMENSGGRQIHTATSVQSGVAFLVVGILSLAGYWFLNRR